MDHVIPEDHNGKDVEKKDGVVPFGDGGEGGADAAIPEEGGPTPPATGNLLVATVASGYANGSVSIAGLTKDNKYIIYSADDKTGGGVYAVAVAGGAPSTILSIPATDSSTGGEYETVVAGNTVFVWTDVTTDSTTGNDIGTLAVIWTEANMAAPYKPALAMTSVGVVDATLDGKKVAYATTNATGSLGTLYGLDITATTPTPQMLLSNTATNATSNESYFNPQLSFVNNDYLVMAHEEMGATTPTVTSWDTAAWGALTLAADPLVVNGQDPLSTSATNIFIGSMFTFATGGSTPGNPVYLATSAGVLESVANGLAGTAAIPIDTGVIAYDVNPDATSIFYSKTSGTSASLLQAPLPLGTPIVTIQSTGFQGFINACSPGIPCSPICESPNDQYTVYSTELGAVLGQYALSLTQDVMGAAPVTILSSNSGTVQGDAFTADSSNVLYFSNFTMTGTGNIWALPVSGGTPPGNAITKNNGWQYNYVGTGTQVVYSDNYMANGGTSGPSGYADLNLADVTKLSSAPTVIMQSTDANPEYLMTSDRKTLIWVMSQGNVHTDGIWAYPIP